jgi:hypothetical protein
VFCLVTNNGLHGIISQKIELIIITAIDVSFGSTEHVGCSGKAPGL